MRAFTTVVLAFAAVSPAAAIPLGSELLIHCEKYCMMAQIYYTQSAFTPQKRRALLLPMRNLRRRLRRSSLGSVYIFPRKLVSQLHMRNQRHRLPKRRRKRKFKGVSKKQDDTILCSMIESYGFTSCNTSANLIANNLSIIFFFRVIRAVVHLFAIRDC